MSWVRVSNAVEDPNTRTALAQDQVVKVVGEEEDWHKIETLDGVAGRVPKVLANPIENPLSSVSEQVACSIAQYDGEREGDLCFGMYSIIVVESVESEGWLRGVVVTDTGKRLGSSGTFPATYVKQLPGFTPPATSARSQTSLPASFTTDFATDVRFRNHDAAPYARAIYEFKGEFANELSFKADDIIYLTKRIDAEWLEGTLGSQTGIFPLGFVQIVVDLPEETALMNSTSTLRHSAASSSAQADEGIGFAVVRHDFQGREKDELSVQMGDSVRVLQMVNGDWVQCRDPNSDSVGIVPIAFLEVYLDEEEEENTGGRQSVASAAPDMSFSTLNNQSFNAPSVVPDWRTSTRMEDVSILSPPAPTVPAQSHEWATFGEAWLSSGNNDIKAQPPARPPPPKSTSVGNQMDQLEKLGLTMDMVDGTKAAGNSSDSDSNPTDPVAQTEKRNKVLEELISSELQFMTDMQAYIEAVESSIYFTTKQKATMKSGCKQIADLAAALIQRLTNEQCKEWDQQHIGLCFLDLRKPFAQTYGYYFRNIDHINSIVNSTSSSTDSKMELALSDLVSKMRSSGAAVFDAPSAVSRPIQRCVKYPLFLSEIAKYTPIHHPDHPKLLEAVKQMSTLGQKMNESKRRKELTKKYSENAVVQSSSTSGSSLGGMLSKLTVHSLKKKSNRFTYRMGTTLGVVKVVRDPDFDRLVNSLDAMERHLVRFNYNLVIYKKKMFFETRQLIQKRLIDIRKKQVMITGMSIETQVMPFHNEVKAFANQLNFRVRDEIVKALRAIPKKLIKKRNDKLMDWEAAKSNMKSSSNSKFLDYEALNTQVKQTLPKVIEVLMKVLRDAMTNVRSLDDKLISDLKDKYKAAAAEAATDPYQIQRLIVPGIPCFCHYYDPNRLHPLQFLVTRVEKKMRLQMHTHEVSKNSIKKKNKSQSDVSLPSPSSSIVTPPEQYSADIFAPSPDKKFRSQTAEERRAILEKADAKGRRADMYRCKADWPASPEALHQNMLSGKMLIVKQGDAVLCVRKDTSVLWLCYNGYYNAHLPSSILVPWYAAKSSTNGDATGETLFGKNSSVVTRPHSTPPKQNGQNLIDLDDFFAPAVPSASPAPLVAAPMAALVPTPVGAAAAANVMSSNSQSTGGGSGMAETGTPSLFDDVRPIDWGAPAPARVSNPWEPFPSQQRAPSLPDLSQKQPSPAPAFPVTFDESPKDPVPPTAISHLPPPGPAPIRSAPNVVSTNQDAFLTLWEQIKDQPLSTVKQRSESPLPLIPTRPGPGPVGPGSDNFASTGFNGNALVPQQNTSALQPSPISSLNSTLTPSYDVVPLEKTTVPSDAFYSIPPQYDAVPWQNSTQQAGGALYETPPTETYSTVPKPAQYDTPPVETPEHVAGRSKLPIGSVQVNFDFSPVGPNQMAVSEGETLVLLQAHDDDGNPEWIWLRRDNGTNGYVPAAYCTPL